MASLQRNLTIDEKWVIADAMFEEMGLVRQHLDSFNDFISKGLQQIIKEEGKIELELPPDVEQYYVRLESITVKEPTVREADGSFTNVKPMEARIRNLTYAGELLLKMTAVYINEDGSEDPGEPEEVRIGYLPIMLKSIKCPLSRKGETTKELREDPKDPGGYFIINGSERVIVTQEDLAPNKILIEKMDGKSSVIALAKVFSTKQGFRAPVTLELIRDGTLRVSFPSVSRKIPLTVLLKALGLDKDRDIMMRIAGKDQELMKALFPALQAEPEVRSEDDALDYIGKRIAVGQSKEYRIQRTEQVLDKYLLPHIGDSKEDRIHKAYYLCQMATRVLELHLGRRDEDDKDHYANKRLNLAGDLLMQLFRNAFRALTRDIKYQLERNSGRGRRPNLRTAVRADVITERLRHALATGNWSGGKAGVSQLLDRTNYMSALSHLRRVVSPLSRSQPHFEARDLHPTHWGKICPNETPEGPNCGLVKNLALQANICTGVDEKIVEEFCENADVFKADKFEVEPDIASVFLNGRLIGFHRDPEMFVEKMRLARRRQRLPSEVNVAYHEDVNEIQINCDHGRVRRPLIIVKDGRPLLKESHIQKLKKGELGWTDLLRQGIIEYLDAEEEENALIAMKIEDITEEHTHVEIEPSTILGITASLIPFPEHNRSDRNVYEAGMAKQALGIYAANFRLRMDTRGHILHYPQIPLVKTHAMKNIGFDERPAGQNFVVALLSYGGYNMEDALILNKASIDRGLGRSTFFRSYESEERKYPGGQEDRFEIPADDARGYKNPEVYRHLAEDGIVEPEAEVDGNKGEVIIGRTSPPRFIEEYQDFNMPMPYERRRETSVSMRFGETGIADLVVITETQEGNKLVKVKMRSLRIPEVGDKFASRHGQKGVIGYIAKQEDLPFSEDGIVPDIIINPHAIPSRMTIGQLLELLSGLLAAEQGKPVYATAFEGISSDELITLLKQHGLHPYGRRVMYDGRTGEKLEAEIFVGIAFYQKLHHLVNDKIHARARGPVQILTRQPTEGRAREGGLKFGEMERDCLIGHGSAIILKERLLDESDKSEILVCEQCGFLAYYNRFKDKMECPICREEVSVSRITVSYAFKLLIQELMSLGIAPKIELTSLT